MKSILLTLAMIATALALAVPAIAAGTEKKYEYVQVNRFDVEQGAISLVPIPRQN